MDNQEENTSRQIQAVLDSLHEIKRATPGPFFYTRVEARLNRAEKGIWETITGLIAKPSIAIAGLCFILMVNSLAIYRQINEDSSTDEPVEIAMVNEYAIGSSNLYDYENTDQK